MKKIFLKTERSVTPLTLLTFICASLQSCCFLFPDAAVYKKTCNCGKDLAVHSSSGRKITQSLPLHNQDDNLASRKVETSLDAIHMDQQPLLLLSEKTTGPRTIGTNENILEITTPISNYSRTDSKKLSTQKPPLGIKAMNTYLVVGPSVSFFSSGDDDSKYKPGLGFQAGIKTTYAFSNQFNVSTGLLVKKNSASETLETSGSGEPGGGDPGNEYKTKYNFTYLSAPIMAEFKTGSGFTLMAGPEFNLLLGANAKTSVNGNNEDKRDTKDDMVKTGIGIQAGVKYNFPHSPLMLQLIYDHRISRIDKESAYVVPGGGGGGSNDGSRMRSIQLGLGCSICSLLNKQ